VPASRGRRHQATNEPGTERRGVEGVADQHQPIAYGTAPFAGVERKAAADNVEDPALVAAVDMRGDPTGDASLGEVLGVYECDERVEAQRSRKLRSRQGERHRQRIGDAARLDDQPLGPRHAAQKTAGAGSEILARGAADAAIGEFRDVLAGAGDQRALPQSALAPARTMLANPETANSVLLT
jgi:hypothetical protein